MARIEYIGKIKGKDEIPKNTETKHYLVSGCSLYRITSSSSRSKCIYGSGLEEKIKYNKR